MKIGVAINTSVRPSRELLLEFERIVAEREAAGAGITLDIFLGSSATKARNLARFAASGLDAIVFAGLPRRIVLEYLKSSPKHPPVVFCTYHKVTEREFAIMRPCAVVMRDNPALGRRAADFFTGRGLRNFAFLGRNGYREDLAVEEREKAFKGRIKEVLGSVPRYSRLLVGEFDSNEDYWETAQSEMDSWIKGLPRPCGIFATGGRLAFGAVCCCKRCGIDVPGEIEVLCISTQNGYCARSRPGISAIAPSGEAMASKALDLALELADDPSTGSGSRVETIDASDFEQRASTGFGRGYGHIAPKAMEFIQLNIKHGISVKDVAAALGVSRRTLEFRVREATGSTVHGLITDARMAAVCELLKTTKLPIGRVLEAAGCPAASSIFANFKKRYGMSMRDFRKHNEADLKTTDDNKNNKLKRQAE